MRNQWNLVCFVLALCLVVAATGPAQAQEPAKVGEHFDVTIDSGGISDVPVVITPTGFRYTLQHDGATYIALHFDWFDLAPGDAVVVSDAEGGQSYQMTGRGKMDAGVFWAQHAKGDTAVIDWVTDGFVPDKGFSIDEYAAGTEDLGDPGIDAICGTDDKENAVCYQSSYPTEYDRSRAVARLLIQGSGLCTGWLASADDHLLTNEHCISTESDALNTDYEFMAEAPDCSDGDACTADTCSGGVCYNDPISCDDGDACTIDSCDTVTGCVYDEPPCQDGDGCCPSGCDSTNDNDCSTCAPLDAPCTSDADCCSNRCRGRPGGMTCK
jgi:hypothetical protein